MRSVPDAELADLAATIAVTRLVLGPSARIQAPPNLIGDEYQLILSAGIDDWGGVSPLTPDHVNPERPWPQIDDLAARTAAGGFELAERLTIYPPYVREPWLDPRLARHVAALADPATGLAAAGARPAGQPWQEPDGGWDSASGLGESGRTDLFTTIDTAGRTSDRRDDFAEVYGDWTEIGARIDPAARLEAAARASGSSGAAAAPRRAPAEVLAALRSAERTRPASATRRRWRCWTPTVLSSTRSPRWPTGCAGRQPATTSPTSSPGTSTSPTSATPAAGSARSRSGAPTQTPTRCPWSRSATAPPRRGRRARPRSACRAASTRTCPAPPTSTSRRRSSGAARTCTCTRSRRWRS